MARYFTPQVQDDEQFDWFGEQAIREETITRIRKHNRRKIAKKVGKGPRRRDRSVSRGSVGTEPNWEPRSGRGWAI